MPEPDYITCPESLLRDWMPRIDSNELDLASYRNLGAIVLRKVVPTEVMEAWIDAWRRFQSSVLASGRRLDPYNQVVLHEPVPEELEAIHRHPSLLDLMERVYPDLGLYLQRFVIKDVHNRDPVFPHQDYCYNLGWPDKTSVMLPLGPMNPANGGLVVYPGTHALGYLGDSGELDPAILAPDWPALAPELEPGDVILMHDCTWHRSPPRVSDVERIVVQITYQPAADPSTAEVLRGRQTSDYSLAGIPRSRFFKRSRSSRLRELQAQVDQQSTAQGVHASSPER